MMKISRLLIAISAGAILSGCATMGKDFDSTSLSWLKAGETAKKDVLVKLGDPFRVGMDSGDQTWTYGYYKYRVFGDSETKDLVIRYTADQKVKSYTLNTSFPDEKEALEPELQPKK